MATFDFYRTVEKPKLVPSTHMAKRSQKLT